MSSGPPLLPPNGQVTERAILGPGRPVLVARIHIEEAEDWPKRGQGLTTAELLPEPVFHKDDTPQDIAHKRAQQDARESSIAVFGTKPHHPLPSVAPGWKGSLRVPDRHSAEHWGGWLRIVPGDAVPVAPLPVGLFGDAITAAVAGHRAMVAKSLARFRLTPSKRTPEHPTAEALLGALLPDVHTLALSIGRPDHIPDARAAARFKVARLMAGVSANQLGRFGGPSPEQISRFEANVEDLSGKYLAPATWAFFPDMDDGRKGMPRALSFDNITKAQQKAYDWILWGGRPWWWVRSSPAENAAVGESYGLPPWAPSLVATFIEWLWSVTAPEQQQLLADHRAVPEVGADGTVALRQFTAYQLRPVLHAAEVQL